MRKMSGEEANLGGFADKPDTTMYAEKINFVFW